MGLFLLVLLCIITDWTIRLIVINAKLSGQTSYIGIMNHCFGSSGRTAVSFFQFAFAFGGQCPILLTFHETCNSQSLRHVRLRHHHWRHHPTRHSLFVSFSTHDTRPIYLFKPSIHHCSLYFMCFLSALTISRYPQAFARLWPCPYWNAHHRNCRPDRRSPRYPRTQGGPITTIHYRWIRDLPSYWCNQFRIR